ncbi:MAG: hypothetical protein F6J98_18070, partial [Moorea sp. SIO4G2]|nr:hypothetical protein [Moorena sp. SIO4G2]
MARRDFCNLSYQLSAISYQLSAISYQLSAISYQLSAISYQLSAISAFHNYEVHRFFSLLPAPYSL